MTATARFVSFQRYITHDCQSYSFQLTADTKRTFLDEYDTLELHISSLLSISGIIHICLEQVPHTTQRTVCKHVNHRLSTNFARINYSNLYHNGYKVRCLESKNPRNVFEVGASGWVKPQLVFFFVLYFCTCFQNKLDRGVGGCGLANPIFLKFLLFSSEKNINVYDVLFSPPIFLLVVFFHSQKVSITFPYREVMRSSPG